MTGIILDGGSHVVTPMLRFVDVMLWSSSSLSFMHFEKHQELRINGIICLSTTSVATA
jgi:hypothetical protein